MEEHVNIRKTLKKTFEDGRRRRREEYMSQEDKVRIFGETAHPQSEEAARLPPQPQDFGLVQASLQDLFRSVCLGMSKLSRFLSSELSHIRSSWVVTGF